MNDEVEEMLKKMKEDLRDIDTLVTSFYRMKEKIMIDNFIVDNDQAESMAASMLSFPFLGKLECTEQELIETTQLIYLLVKNYERE